MVTKSNTPMFQAMQMAEQKQKSGTPGRVFDWLGAVELIKAYGIKNADAGLVEDWSYTADCILQDGTPRPNDDIHAYLSSAWATPVLEDTDTGQLFECWIWEHQSTWAMHSDWPEEVRKLLE